MALNGRIESLHVHPQIAGETLLPAAEFNMVSGKGIREDKRYFGRRNREGLPSKRQVTIIEREILRDHASALGIADLAPGEARSNIEVTGISLVSLIGRNVQIGEAIVQFVEPRTPCHKMDKLAKGLRALMENGRQGVIAIVVKDGKVRPGDSISPVQETSLARE